MFNSPLLDVTIGLVFIFLLYSLLATSINEVIATLFGLRARMLKTAIVERMLADTPQDNRWMAVYTGIKEFIMEIVKILVGKREKKEDEKKIGDHFFDHPLIKNYGSSRLFPLPSYISAKNFSKILLDVLKDEFHNKRIDEIANHKLGISANDESFDSIKQDLSYSSDIIKIKELLDHYGRLYSGRSNSTEIPVIDKETWQILNLHMRESNYNAEKFTEKIESWFDDSMDRASGWYKRQTQIILLLIGIFLCTTFNVDTIQISHKLSIDKDARDKLVNMAIEATEKYKDDPRVKKIVSNGVLLPDTSYSSSRNNDSIFQIYKTQRDSIKNFLDSSLTEANDIIAIGWGDYGMRRDSAKILNKYLADTKYKNLLDPKDSIKCKEFLLAIYDKHWIKYKVGYVLNETRKGRKFLGFLITALAISLGAPFWFDLLNKLVKIRAAGKKEESSGSNATNNSNTPQSITIHVNPQSGDEAVG